MSRVYGRQYDVKNISNNLLGCQYEEYKPDMNNTSWNDVMNAGIGLNVYLSPKAVKLVENKHLMIARNIFHKDTSTFVFDDDKIPPTIIFPTYNAKEDYKIQFAKFLGEGTVGHQKYENEYEQLIPLMFEYFYLSLHSDDPEKEFELRNLLKSIKPAKKFLKEYNLYHKIPDFYDISNYESEVLRAMQNFSSFDVALQLIEMMKSDKDKALGLVDDIILQKGKTYDILADSDVYSYGYKSLKKTIERRKK